MKKILIIEDLAKSIIFKNRKIRTPVSLEVSDTELKALKVVMHMVGIKDWKISTPKIQEDEVVDYDFYEADVVVVEELEDEPSTTLEKLMKNGDRE